MSWGGAHGGQCASGRRRARQRPSERSVSFPSAAPRRHRRRLRLGEIVARRRRTGRGSAAADGEGLLPGADAVGEHDAIEGLDLVSDVVLVDQSPLGRSSRSNPATVTKAWDEVRALLARTLGREGAQAREGGLQFQCGGRAVRALRGRRRRDGRHAVPRRRDGRLRRLRRAALQARGPRGAAARPERGRAPRDDRRRGADALRGRARSRGSPPAARGRRTRLPHARPVHGDALGRGGAAPEDRVASSRGPTSPKDPVLFVFDEPTTGLAPSDVDVLLAVFRRLLAAGHSLVAVEHNTVFLARADHMIELGPGGGPDGGRIVFEGPPAALAARGGTPTAASLRGRVQFGPR